MLAPNYLEAAPEGIVELYSKLDEAIIRDIVRRLVKTGGVTLTADWQIQRLQESGLLFDDIVRQVSQLTNASEPHVRALFQDAGVEALEYDFAIYEAAGLVPLPLLQSPAAAMILQAGIQKTQGYLKNLSLTTATITQQAYINAVTLAEMQVESGAFDYIAAIRNAVRDAAQAGAAVLYPTGHVDKLDVAVRRAVLTGVSQTSAQISERYADDMGCDLVETTAHPGARPSHMLWQGRVFSRSGGHSKYPDFVASAGYGTGAGLCGYNCRHSFFPFFEGLSASAYPRHKLAEYENKTVQYNEQTVKYYDATQMQRSMERDIRATKRELAGYDEGVKATNSEDLRNAMKEKFSESSVKLKRQESELKDFLGQTGLDRQREREQVISFGRSPAQSARQSAERRYQQWIKDIGAKDSAPKTLANYYKEKYNNSPAYQLLKQYSKDVEEGWISPVSGFANYQKQYNRIQNEIVGNTTPNGIKITGQVPHFLQRIIGTAVDPKKLKENLEIIRRSGVEVDDIKNTLFQPERIDPVAVRKNGNCSVRFIGQKCVVTLNPDTGMLIQTNPRKVK